MARLLTVPVVCLVVMAATAPAAPIPDVVKEPVLFFPTTPVTWVYECHGAGNEPVREEVRAVISVTDQGGAKLVTIGTVEGGRVTSGGWVVAVSARGLVSGSKSAGGAFDPDATLLRTPAVAGDRWVVSRSGGVVRERRYATRGPEEVVVPAGRLQAVAVDITCVEEGGASWRERAWFAPGVGVVRWEFDHGRFHVLKRLIRGAQWEVLLPREVQP
jgi:hypothetical protein